MEQIEKVKECLAKDGKIDENKAIGELGVKNLRSIIATLKKQGMRFTCEKTRNGNTIYAIDNSPIEEKPKKEKKERPVKEKKPKKEKKEKIRKEIVEHKFSEARHELAECFKSYALSWKHFGLSIALFFLTIRYNIVKFFKKINDGIKAKKEARALKKAEKEKEKNA